MFPMTKTGWALYFSLTWLDATLLYFAFWGRGSQNKHTKDLDLSSLLLSYWGKSIGQCHQIKITLNSPPLKNKWDKKFYFILCYVFIHLSATVIQKKPDKGKLGEKGFIWLKIPYYMHHGRAGGSWLHYSHSQNTAMDSLTQDWLSPFSTQTTQNPFA